MSNEVKKHDNTGQSFSLAVFTGVMIYVALSLLFNPDIGSVQSDFATFYGDF
jgi:hypothetical protein